MVIRLKGNVVMLNDGGYVASFGPHNSAWNCGPPTWPSAAHQAADLPPYAEWCDLSVHWAPDNAHGSDSQNTPRAALTALLCIDTSALLNLIPVIGQRVAYNHRGLRSFRELADQMFPVCTG